MTVGDKNSLYRKRSDSERSLKEAIVIAENQTDISKRAIERKLITLNRDLKRANQALASINKYPVNEHDVLRKNNDFSSALSRMNRALSDIKKDILKSALDNGVIVSKGAVSGFEGDLPSSNGDYLLMYMKMNQIFINQAYIFTNLNQEWKDTVYLSKETAVFSSASPVDDDLSALELAIVGINKYERKHKPSTKN